MRRLVWQGVHEPRMEIAHVRLERDRLSASGTQIGAGYELRYELKEPQLRLEIVGERSLELELEEGNDHFDLEYAPLFNSLPVLRHGLHRGGEPHDFVMALILVPSLEVHRSEQRYEPFAPGLVRFRSGGFSAMLELDDDGLVVRYPGLAERLG